MSSRSRQAKDIFMAAAEIDSLEEREHYLDEACEGDQQVRSRVEELLASLADVGSFMDHKPAVAFSPTLDMTRIAEKPGSTIGRYKLLQQIGEGGFGVVYMAEQIEPVRRKVALKVIKPGMDSKEVIARFESERQALALMDHPNIAKVLDAGTTDSGLPYFVMELVKGVPLVDFCDENSLTTQQRLKLFVTTCRAIQHAHQKGIIHRDLKPSNVMVTLQDNKPVPKVIDFGVSKALSQQLTEKTLFTAYGQMVGTPIYMSPEQAQMSGMDIDTRSDIYSLGVILYEMLTGTTPLDAERLRKSGYAEMQRLIREEDAPRPSLRLSTTEREARAKIARNRGTNSKQLGYELQGDLDWIVMKALEKECSRRYDTANSFADDVERFLKNDVVQACPPSVGYRLRKLASRYKVIFLGASVIMATLLIGIATTTWQAIAATNARNEAEAERTKALEAQGIADTAREHAEQARRDAEVQRQLAEQRLGIANRAYESELAQRSEAERQQQRAEKNFNLAWHAVDALLTDVASTELLDVPQMEPLRRSLLERALSFYQSLLNQKSEEGGLRQETARAYQRLGDIHRELGDFAKAENAYRQAVANFQLLCDKGHPCSIDLARAQNQLSLLFKTMGQLQNAKAAYAKALQLALKAEVIEDPQGNEKDDVVATIQLNAALVDMGLGHMAEAEAGLKRALEAYQGLAEKSPDKIRYLDLVATSSQNLAALYTATGRYEESDDMLSAAVETRRRLVAKSPTSTRFKVGLALCLNSLGSLRKAQSRDAEAQAVWTDAIKIWQSVVIAHPNVPQHKSDLAGSFHNLGVVHKDGGRYRDAAEAFQKAQVLHKELAGTWPNVPAYRRDLALTLNSLGNLYRDLGQLGEALSCYQSAIGLQRQLIRDHPKTIDYSVDLAGTLVSLGYYHLTAGELDKALATYEQTKGQLQAALLTHPSNARARNFLVKADGGLKETKRQIAAQSNEATDDTPRRESP